MTKDTIRIEIEIEADADAMKMLASAPFSEVVDYHIKAGKGSINGSLPSRTNDSVSSVQKLNGYYSIALDSKTGGTGSNRVLVVSFNGEFQDFEKRFSIGNLMIQYSNNEVARNALSQQRTPLIPKYEGTDLKAIRDRLGTSLIRTRVSDYRVRKVFPKKRQSGSTDT